MLKQHLGIYAFALSLIFTGISANGEGLNETLSAEMTKLNIDTALILGSNAMDDYPLWSQNSNYVAVNVMGK